MDPIAIVEVQAEEIRVELSSVPRASDKGCIGKNISLFKVSIKT